MANRWVLAPPPAPPRDPAAWPGFLLHWFEWQQAQWDVLRQLHLRAAALEAGSVLTGDVTKSAGDTATTIATKAVTLAKMADLAQDKLIGRKTAGTGAPEPIDCTAAGRALLDDADATAQRTTLGLGSFSTKSSLAQSKGFIQIDLAHRPYYGSHASAPTLAAADGSLTDATDGDGFTMGKSFPDAAISWIAFSFIVPPDLDTTAPVSAIIHFRLGANASAGDKVELGVTYRAVNLDELCLSAGSSESNASPLNVTGYSSGDDGYVTISTAISANQLSVYDLVKGVIYRNATAGNANDTFANSVTGLAVMFEYTKTALT